MLSIMIDAREGRDVATADVAGAYLNADMNDFVILKMTGSDLDILCQILQKDFIEIENGRKCCTYVCRGTLWDGEVRVTLVASDSPKHYTT